MLALDLNMSKSLSLHFIQCWPLKAFQVFVSEKFTTLSAATFQIFAEVLCSLIFLILLLFVMIRVL